MNIAKITSINALNLPKVNSINKINTGFDTKLNQQSCDSVSFTSKNKPKRTPEQIPASTIKLNIDKLFATGEYDESVEEWGYNAEDDTLEPIDFVHGNIIVKVDPETQERTICIWNISKN